MNEKVDQHSCISCGNLYSPQEGDTGLCPRCALFIVQSSPPLKESSKSPEQYCISCLRLYHPQAGDAGLCPQCASSIVQSSPSLKKSSKHPEKYCVSCGKPYHPQVGDTGLCPQCASSIAQSSPIGAVRSRTSPSESVNSEIWQEGQTLLDTYEVKGKLGEGGMGIVYRVHHNAWNLDLALKQPKAEVVAEAGMETFVNEAQAWVDLGLHPHITTCYYVRKIEGLPCVFAELVEGGSLDDWIKKGKLRRLEDMLDVAIQFAWGLHYAHELGMIHQDVKPDNVLIKEDGAAKVTDFGLVKVQTKGPMSISGKGTILAEWGGGTKEYFSPEQSAAVDLSNQAWQWAEAGEKKLSDQLRQQIGQLPKPTRRTDLWSWAVSVLEMFNGKRSWAYGSAAAESLETYLERGSAVAGLPAMPPAVGALLEECFQEEPDKRPHDLQVAAERLVEVYREVVGKPYFRQEPKAVDLRADSLNNKALSLLDLGQEKNAIKTWNEALGVDPLHVETTFNLRRLQWQNAELTDMQVVEHLEALKINKPDDWRVFYLLGLIHLEREDINSAKTNFLETKRYAPGKNFIQEQINRLSNRSGIRCLDTLNSEDGIYAKFTPDSKRIIFGGRKNTIRIRSADSGDVLEVLRGHAGKIYSLDTSFDGKFVFSGSDDNTLRLWDVNTGNCIRVFRGHSDSVLAAALFPEKNLGISGSADQTMRLWNLNSGKCLYVLRGHSDFIRSIAVCPDGYSAISASSDNTLRLWDIRSKKCTRIFEGHTDGVNGVVITPDGKHCLSGSDDRTLKLWNIETGQCVHTFEVPGQKDYVNVIAISPDGRLVLSGRRDSTIYMAGLAQLTEEDFVGKQSLRLWDIETRQCIRTFEEYKDIVYSIAFSPDNKKFIVGTEGRYELWTLPPSLSSDALREHQKQSNWRICQPTSSKELLNVKVVVKEDLQQAKDAFEEGNINKAVNAIRRVRTTPGYERDAKQLKLWHEIGMTRGIPKTINAIHHVNTLKGHTNWVSKIIVTHDGKFVISGGWDGKILIRDFHSGEVVSRINPEQWLISRPASNSIDSLAITKDDRLLAFNFSNKVGVIKSLEGAGIPKFFKPHGKQICDIAITPDNSYLIYASDDDTLRLCKLPSGNCKHTYCGHSSMVSAVCISPDGRMAISGSWDCTAKLWDLNSEACLKTFVGHRSIVNDVAITSNGLFAVTASKDKTIKVWNIKTGDCVNTLFGHEHSIRTVSLTPDGRFAVSGSRDQTVRCWDLSSGQCLNILQGHLGEVETVEFSPDARFILSGGADKTIRVWQADWDFDFPEPKDWDEHALPYFKIFLVLHSNANALRKGKVSIREKDFEDFLIYLQHCGYGWLRPEGVRRKLNELMQTWEGP